MVILGIRKNTAYRIFLVEFSINVLAAAVIGLPIGMIGAAVLRRGFARSFQGHIELPSVVSVSQVLIGFAAYVMLMILALGFNQENFISLGNSTELNEERKKRESLRHDWLFGLYRELVYMSSQSNGLRFVAGRR